MDNPRNTSEAADAATTAPQGGCGCGCGSNDKPALADLGQPTMGPADDLVDESEFTATEPEASTEGGCCQGGQQGEDITDGDDNAPAADAAEESSDESCCGQSPSHEHGDCHSDNPEHGDLQQQLDSAIEATQRVAAEYANFRRRTERDRAGIGAVAKVSVIAELLPVVDDLDLAIKHGDLTGSLKAVNEKLRGILTKYDVTKFGQEGDEFNPELHEAVQDLSESDTKVIGTVLRPGYMMGERLVRTAMVIIADQVAPEDNPS